MNRLWGLALRLRATRSRCLVAAVLAGALLSGCAAAGSPGSAAAPGVGLLLPGKSSPNSILLYNRYQQRFMTYDTMRADIDEASNVTNYFQYEFAAGSEYYTAGSSVDNGFSILRVAAENIDTVVNVGPDEGIFPLATDGTTSIFTLSTYSEDGSETDRRLVRLESDLSLAVYANTAGLFDGGAIVGDDLFYTTYEEGTDDYTLHRVPVADLAATPDVVDRGLESGRLYLHDGALLTATKSVIQGYGIDYECADLCYFEDELGVLIRIAVDDNSDLSLDVLSSATGEVLSSTPGVIDYRVDGSVITVYRRGGPVDIPVEP